jgi:hypothetical protein
LDDNAPRDGGRSWAETWVRERVCSIVGVAPEGFRGHDPIYAPDVWAPLRPLNGPKLLASRGMAFFSGVMARLKPQGFDMRGSDSGSRWCWRSP